MAQTYEDRPSLAAWNALEAGITKIATGSYVGTGVSGAANPTAITFPFTPKLVLVFTNHETSLTTQMQPFWTFLWNYTSMTAYGNYKSTVSYSGNTLSVCYTKADNVGIYQMNNTGEVYTWLAIG